MRDSQKYSDSIFYESSSNVREYSNLDKIIIKMLYRPDVKLCMKKTEAKRVLENVKS